MAIFSTASTESLGDEGIQAHKESATKERNSGEQI
jgi:hypothetical protein